jgi:hypothetical protein
MLQHQQNSKRDGIFYSYAAFGHRAIEGIHFFVCITTGSSVYTLFKMRRTAMFYGI